MPTNATSLCVYTCMMGGYERLNAQPVAAESGAAFLCLTDDAALASDSWTMVPVQPAFDMDPIRSQRILKLMPHAVPALAGFDYSLYIDNSVVLKRPPEDIVDQLGWGPGLALPRHSYRDTVLDEFIEVARIPADDPTRVYEQLNHYLTYGEATLQERPYWAAIMLRRHCDPLVQAAMELWCAHVLRYSRRDQLSCNLALARSGLTPQAWEIDNFESWFHSWPHRHEQRCNAGPRDPLASAAPPAARLRQLEARLADAAVETGRLRERLSESEAEMRRLSATVGESETEMRRLSAMVGESEARTGRLKADLAGRDDEVAKLRTALAAIRSSTSWRLTAPLRAVGGVLGR